MVDHPILSLGILLITALVAGQVAHRLRLPRVTAYLLVGLLLGPHALAVVKDENLTYFHPLGEMAMALVLFNMGCHFSLEYFRRIMRRALWLSFGELSVTLFLVTVGVLLVGASWQCSLLLGVLALATAPATTMLVLRENDSEGPVTEYAYSLVALNNLAAVILFEAVLVAMLFFAGDAGVSPAGELLVLTKNLVLAVVFGVAAGLAVSYACSLLSTNRWLVLLAAAVTMLLGICEAVGEIPYLLTFLAMGTTVANASERTKAIVDELDHATGLLCVVFFVIHGADMDLRALQAAGWIGLAYVLMRSLGKYTGIWLTGERDHNSAVRNWLGLALLSQAGAALALSDIAQRELPDGTGAEVKVIILGTVVVFEIFGPLCIRQALLGAGEVPLENAIYHHTTTAWLEVQRIVNRLQVAIGIDPWRNRSAEELTVNDLMRTNIETIDAATPFDELVSVLERSHDNVFPVTGGDGRLVGVIRYRDLRNAVFDPTLSLLVCAIDLAQPVRHVLSAKAPIAEAWKMIRRSSDDVLPVVSDDDQTTLVGLVARRDLYRFFLRYPK